MDNMNLHALACASDTEFHTNMVPFIVSIAVTRELQWGLVCCAFAAQVVGDNLKGILCILRFSPMLLRFNISLRNQYQ